MNNKNNIEQDKKLPSLKETILEEGKNFKDLILLGYDDQGQLHIKTTVNNFPFVQYTLSKAQFEVHVIEKNVIISESHSTEKETEEVLVSPEVGD